MTMPFTINSKMLLSVASIAAAAALIIGATFAFFSDEETSVGNTFAAGELDLKVDSEAHYAGLVCTGEHPTTVWAEESTGSATRPDLIGDPCNGTWAQSDLGPTHKFFDLSDVKPGDTGEDTISLHVIDNDAWTRLVIDNIQDNENGCGGEEEADDPNCSTEVSPDGELQDNLLFNIWLDEGATNGFQCSGDGEAAECTDDPTEGDNIQQGTEPTLVTPGTLDSGGETLNVWEGLAAAYVLNTCTGDGSSTSDCPGLASDGRMVGSINYYFGLGWELPDTVGNEVQTDSLVADMTFEAEQHRNNTTPFAP